MFSKLTLAFTTILAVAVYAAPTAPASSSQQCSTGPVQCCNTVQESKDFNFGILGLGSLASIAASVTGLVAADCIPVTVLGISGNSCSAQTVCCTDVSQNGLVNFGCSPVNVVV